MSEVKRYAIYGEGKWEAREVKAGAWVRWYDFDAQRLRADTAEAELSDMQHWRDLALQFDNHRMNAMFHLKTLVSDGAHYDAARDFLSEPPLSAHEVVAKLAAAEQRIASHEKLLRRIAKHYDGSNVRELHRAIDEIDAALNPNPEAESHE